MAARRRWVVGLAVVSSCYGGPEEGGWDYEAGKPTGGFLTFFNEESARAARDFFAERIEDGDGFRGVGVGGCGDNDDFVRGQSSGDGLEAVMEARPLGSRGGLTAWPEHTPRYE